MTVQTVPAYLQNASHSAALFRQATTAPFSSAGILGSGELAVTQQTSPNMSIQLGAGRAMVPGSFITPPAGLSFTTQGMYFVLNDAPVTLTVSAADATNPRIDVVYVQVQDSFYSGSNNQTIAGIATGTPAASPTVPALPSNALAIAQISVPANATAIQAANITTVASMAVLNAGAPTWTTPTLGAGWTAASPTAPGYALWQGIVWLRGRANWSGSGSYAAFTLPAGMRPANTIYRLVDSPNTSAANPVRLSVDSSGNVSVLVDTAYTDVTFDGVYLIPNA